MRALDWPKINSNGVGLQDYHVPLSSILYVHQVVALLLGDKQISALVHWLVWDCELYHQKLLWNSILKGVHLLL